MKANSQRALWENTYQQNRADEPNSVIKFGAIAKHLGFENVKLLDFGSGFSPGIHQTSGANRDFTWPMMFSQIVI